MAVSNCSALNLGLETLVCSNAPHLEWEGACSKMESLPVPSELSERIIVTDLDSALGQECVNRLGSNNYVSIIALTGTSSEDQIDAAVLKGLKGVVDKAAPNRVLLKAILAVYKGELWLDRLITSRIMRELTAGEVKPARLLDQLTKRERMIYKTVVNRAAVSLRQIAKDLNISEHTLRNHLTAIYSKLGVSSRIELLVLSHGEN